MNRKQLRKDPRRAVSKFMGDREATEEHLNSAAAIPRKQFVSEVEPLNKSEKAEDDDSLKLRFVISTGSIDRHGDTVNPAGWHTDAYEKNPVVLFGHDYRQPPIGRASDIVATKTTGKLKATAEFMSEDLYPFSYTLYRMYEAGFMKAVSVGFRPIKWKWADEDDEERGFLDIDFQEQELLEFSAVPVPANPEALVGAKDMGIPVAPLGEWAEQTLDTWERHKASGLMVPRETVEGLYKEASRMSKATRKSKPSKKDDKGTTGDEELDNLADKLQEDGDDGDDEAAIEIKDLDSAVNFVKEFLSGEIGGDELGGEKVEDLHAKAKEFYDEAERTIPELRHFHTQCVKNFPEIFALTEEGELAFAEGVTYEDHSTSEDKEGDETDISQEEGEPGQELDAENKDGGGSASEAGDKDDDGTGDADKEVSDFEEMIQKVTTNIMEGVSEAVERSEQRLSKEMKSLQDRVEALEQEQAGSADDGGSELDEEEEFSEEKVSAMIGEELSNFMQASTGKLG